jgi:hypothetical protein
VDLSPRDPGPGLDVARAPLRLLTFEARSTPKGDGLERDPEVLALLRRFRGDRSALVEVLAHTVREWTDAGSGRSDGELYVYSYIQHQHRNGAWHYARGRRQQRTNWRGAEAQPLVVDLRRTQRRLAAAYAARFPGESLVPILAGEMMHPDRHEWRVALGPDRPDVDEYVEIGGLPKWMVYVWNSGATVLNGAPPAPGVGPERLGKTRVPPCRARGPEDAA